MLLFSFRFGLIAVVNAFRSKQVTVRVVPLTVASNEARVAGTTRAPNSSSCGRRGRRGGPAAPRRGLAQPARVLRMTRIKSFSFARGDSNARWRDPAG